ncbi:MAG: hypothetical protein ACE3L7_03495 [Candidatus Pristimantibacillus sp.]
MGKLEGRRLGTTYRANGQATMDRKRDPWSQFKIVHKKLGADEYYGQIHNDLVIELARTENSMVIGILLNRRKRLFIARTSPLAVFLNNIGFVDKQLAACIQSTDNPLGKWGNMK